MYEVPTSVTIGERSFTIRNRGDYRIVFDCFSCLNDEELTKQEKIFACLIIFYDDFNDIEDVASVGQETFNALVEEMYRFFYCGEDNVGIKTSFKALDWDNDSQLICAGVNKVSHMEVRTVEYLHWWTFMGYFMEIGESVIATVVSIRSKIMKGKKLEKYEQEFKKNNPQYFVWDSRTEQQKEDEQAFKELWNDV